MHSRVLRVMSLEHAGSGRFEAALTELITLVPKGLDRFRDWGSLGWKMDTLTTLHNPAAVSEDGKYPMFPEERGAQNHIIPIDICDIKVGGSLNGTEFHRYPCSVVDFRARTRDGKLERHLLLKLNG